MHTGPITSVVVSNNRVYTGGYDKNIFIWDDKMNSTYIDSHNHLINDLAVSNYGDLLASASSDYSIRLYDIKNNNKLLNVFKGHADDIEAVAFSKDDKYLISVSRDKRCFVWNVNTGKIENIYENHQKDVLSVWIYDSFVFTSSDDGTVQKWNLHTGENIGEIGPFSCELDTIDGSIENKVLAIGADDGNIIFYDIDNLSKVGSFKAHDQGIKKVAFSNGGQYLLSAGYDHSIKIWDYKTHRLVKQLQKSNNQWERSLVWSTNNDKVFGGSFGKTFCEWNVETGKIIERDYNLSTPSINDFAISYDKVYTASDDGILRVNGKEIKDSPTVLCNAVSCSEDGVIALWGDHSSKVYLVIKEQLVASFNLNTGPVNTIFFDESSNCFYVGTYGGFVHIIDPIVRKEISKFRVHDGAIKSLVTTLDKIILVTADYRILAFNKNNHFLFKEYFGPTAIVNDISLLDENHFVIASRDKIVRIYSLLTGAIINQHNKHMYSIKSIVVDSDKNIISGDYWGNIVIWNAEYDKVSEPIKIAQNGISSLNVLNNYIYGSSYDGAIYRFTPDGESSVHFRLFSQSKDIKLEENKVKL